MADDQQAEERRKLSPELKAIHARLDSGDVRMETIEQSIAANTKMTQQIMQNTSGLVAFSDDLASGSRFLCRVIKGVQFILKDVIDPYWKPALICFIAISWAMNGFTLPHWVPDIFKALFG